MCQCQCSGYRAGQCRAGPAKQRGHQKWLHNPAILGAYLWAKWLHNPYHRKDHQSRAEIRSGYITPVVLGVPKAESKLALAT